MREVVAKSKREQRRGKIGEFLVEVRSHKRKSG